MIQLTQSVLATGHRSLSISSVILLAEHLYSSSFHFSSFVNNKKEKSHLIFRNHSSRLGTLSEAAALMAGESENFTSEVAVDDDVKYGFQRPEMYESNLAGTVDPPYGRHVFLCYKSHDVWPSHVENSDADPLPKLLAATFKARRGDFSVRTLLTIIEGREDIGLSEGDVLIFPDMIKYRGLKESDVDSFVEDVLVSGNPWASGVQEVLSGSFVFVCAHNSRDRRCGVCGPPLIQKFEEEIEAKALKDQIFVTACSHIGGHKYAGNLIVFSADSEGKIAGHWYGYITPNDVPELLDQHIGKGEIIQRLWRGQMGASIEKANGEQKIANGTTTNNVEQKPEEIAGKEKQETVMSCCQGAIGFQCCRDVSPEEEKQEKKRPSGLSGWTGKWEQRDVLTIAAVAGAVAAVAVAYGFYRKSR